MLESEKILELEFNYIKETAHQANQDRHKMLNFYIGISTTVGTLSIGILSLADTRFTDGVAYGIALVVLLVGITGWVFLAMMIRLRQSWHESMVAMNTLKSFYIENSENKLSPAFMWDFDTLPKPHRLWNIHFYSTGLVIFISSLALGLFVGLIISPGGAVAAGVVMGFLTCLFSIIVQLFIYWISLKRGY